MSQTPYIFRPEKKSDREAIRGVNQAAFGQPGEARLVDLLREQGALPVSLVVEVTGVVVGHIAFSPVTLDRQPEVPGAVGLGPMAVLPAYQRQGIGLAMIRAGLDACREAGFDLVVVLGHPTYYPKAGFETADRFGISSPWDVPEEVFMVQVLKEGALTGYGGVVHYHPAFDAVT